MKGSMSGWTQTGQRTIVDTIVLDHINTVCILKNAANPRSLFSFQRTPQLAMYCSGFVSLILVGCAIYSGVQVGTTSGSLNS